MKIASKEMQQVAAVADAVTAQQPAAIYAPRFDMYGPIHKALRAFMADTLLAVARMDVDDEPELVRTVQRVFELMEFCNGHLTHENDFIHTAMEARAPGTSGHIAGDHHEHVRHIHELSVQAGALLRLLPGERPAAARSLYHALSAFVAHNFEHMLHEERHHNAVLWAHYTDAELLGIHDALVASIPPGEMMVVVRWMVPFMNPAERTAMLSGMQAMAPAPAFDAALETVRPHLTAAEWGKLMRSLGLAAAPGLVQG